MFLRVSWRGWCWFSSFIKPISFSAKVIWDTAPLHPLPLLISPPAEKFSFPQLFLSPSTGLCLHLVNKVGKGPGSSSRAPSVPNALNGHDTALNFRFSANAGETSAGRDLGSVTVSSNVAISLLVIRCHLEPTVLQCQSSVDLHNCPPVQSTRLFTSVKTAIIPCPPWEGRPAITRWVIYFINLEWYGARKTQSLCRKPRWLTFTNWGALLFISFGMFHSRLGEVRWSLALGGVFCCLQCTSKKTLYGD